MQSMFLFISDSVLPAEMGLLVVILKRHLEADGLAA